MDGPQVSQQDRQRIYLAAELLSRTVANALEIMYPENIKMQTLSKFIKLIDMWFDIFNRLVSVAFLVLGSQQAVISHQAVVRQSGSCQAVIRQSSASSHIVKSVRFVIFSQPKGLKPIQSCLVYVNQKKNLWSYRIQIGSKMIKISSKIASV